MLSAQASVEDDNNTTAGQSGGFDAWLETNVSVAAGGSVGGFEYLNVDAVNRQFSGRGQTREPSTDDDDVMVRHRLGALEGGAYR